MRRSRSTSIGTEDIWPGFTDALAGILLVLIFLITIFVVTENILTSNLSGRDEAIIKLNKQTKLMEEVLGLRLKEISELHAEVKAANLMLKNVRESNEQLEVELATSRENNVQAGEKIAALQSSEVLLTSAKDQLLQQVDAQALQMQQLLQRLTAINEELLNFRKLLEESQIEHAQAVEKNTQLEARADSLDKQLNKQIKSSKLQLAKANQENKQLTAKAASLGEKLNRLLAERVKLLSKYRSDFFGKMRAIIGDDNPDIRIIGDRFVLQSEVLFTSGSEELLPKGKSQLLRVAKLLSRLGRRIPKKIPWVIQISGHTDNVPINSERFPSNWELSSARAINVVKYLIKKGKISPKHLIATGFGQFHPLGSNKTEKLRRQNRRIELKITTP